MILTSQTLSDFLEKLPTFFIRIHKSFAKNFKQLEMLDRNHVILQNNVKLMVGKSYRKELLLRIVKESK